MKYTIATDAVGTTWPFEEFVRMHGEYGAVVVADSKRGLIEYGIFEDVNNNQTITCISNVVKKYSGEEFEKNKPNRVQMCPMCVTRRHRLAIQWCPMRASRRH